MRVAKMRGIKTVAAALFLLVAASGVAIAQVSVWAEGAYTATDLAIYIYANTGSDTLCSFGVKLSYDSTKLNTPTATKNEEVWYFGTAAAPQPYMNPDTATAGQVIFIGGKLDTGNPQAGVTGPRVLLGKAVFSRKNQDPPGATPESYFGISTALGKASPYDNFVTTAGVVKDGGLTFAANTVRARGDANADGLITARDIATLRGLIENGTYVVYADCDNNGLITSRDIACVRGLLQ